MANPRRSSHSSINIINNSHSNQSAENSPSQFHGQSLWYQSLIHFLKKPLAFPFLLSVFLLLTWVSLRLQRSSSPSPASELSQSHSSTQPSRFDDSMANLRRLSSEFSKDKRGWLINPVSLALDSGLPGGALMCASVHVGEIRPGGIRGNHRHYSCNETFVIWGARTKFRLENNHAAKGYAEVIIGADEVAIAASPSGTAHAIVNVDPVKTTYLLGCQDSIVNYNTTTDFNVWNDLR